jgi:hypothetical protein
MRAASQGGATIEPLEGRLLCRVILNGEFVIAPPGGGQAHETIKLHPAEGAIGLRIATANSNGVVNWQNTAEHVWTPGDHSGPHQFA